MTTDLRDPAGLLARSPELARLAERSPALRRAIERGKPHAVYRTLAWEHRLRRFGDLSDDAAVLVAHRRLFFVPLNGAPTMVTLNGVGTKLYGQSERDENDGTYVATLFFVILFVPLYPLTSYLVRTSPTGQGWGFFAKVPVSPGARLWQHAVALGLVVLAAVAGVEALTAYGHNTLHVVNALPVDVTASLDDGTTTTVPAGRDAALTSATGRKNLTIASAATHEVLEREVVDIPAGRTTVAWNILGAGAVYFEQVVYTSSKSFADRATGVDPEVLCGTRLIVRDGVDFPFHPPPEKLSGSGTEAITRSAMGYVEGGLMPCAKYLIGANREDEARRIVFAVARATKASAKTMGQPLEAVLLSATAAEADVFTRQLVTWDDSVLGHRLRQQALLGSGERDEAIAEYEARRAANPTSADAAYLAARVLARRDELPRLDAAVEQFPDHALLRRAHAMVHASRQDWTTALASLERLAKLDAEMGAQMLESRVEALVALGRGKDALALLGSILRTTENDNEITGLELRVHVALDPAFEPAARGTRSSTEGDRPLFHRAAAGLPISDAALAQVDRVDARDALHIALDARTQPAAALARAEKATVGVLYMTPVATRFLLLGAAVSEGREPLVAKIAQTLHARNQALTDVATYVKTGVAPDGLFDLASEQRAALDVARSHRADVSPKERAELRAQARALDVLHGPVTLAAAAWVP